MSAIPVRASWSRHGRVSTLDRLVLRIGMALVVWSRRRQRVALDHDQHMLLRSNAVARAARETEANKRCYLHF